MNLAHATFEYAFPGMFILKQVVLYRCWSSIQPWLAEIVLAQICQGYTVRAGGLSHYPAGYSNASACRKTPMKSWIAFQKSVEKNGALLKSLKNAIEVRDAWVERIR